MEEIAAVLVSAFDAHEITMGEFADAVRSLRPEIAQLIAALFSTASMVEFSDGARRRHARMVCSQVARMSRSLN